MVLKKEGAISSLDLNIKIRTLKTDLNTMKEDKIKLGNIKVEFKSIPEYYHPESLGLKNCTIREIDWEDERFPLLQLMNINIDFGFIIITSTEKCQGQVVQFVKRIKHICIWEKYMIITWEV